MVPSSKISFDLRAQSHVRVMKQKNNFIGIYEFDQFEFDEISMVSPD